MVSARKQNVVLVFGVFDGLHDGHQFFLREVRKLGNYLIVSVAQDKIVQEIKKNFPTYNLAERLKMLEESGLVDQTVPGDTELGAWSAVRKWKPDIVAVGYDQTPLEESLREFIKKEKLPLTIVNIKPHEPARLHSRLLRKN
ncbi:MAG TPA: adenylyltransferase/cytidyltransferase family protein [Candidatus Paceibacterota bacterium]